MEQLTHPAVFTGEIGHIFGIIGVESYYVYPQPCKRTKRALRRYRHKRILKTRPM